MTLSLRVSPSIVQKCPLRSYHAGAGSMTSAKLTRGRTIYGTCTATNFVLDMAASDAASSGIMPVENTYRKSRSFLPSHASSLTIVVLSLKCIAAEQGGTTPNTVIEEA